MSRNIAEVEILFIVYRHSCAALAELYRGAAKCFREGSPDASRWNSVADVYKESADGAREELKRLGIEWSDGECSPSLPLKSDTIH